MTEKVAETRSEIEERLREAIGVLTKSRGSKEDPSTAIRHCSGALTVGDRWHFMPEPGTECEKVLHNLGNLGREVRKYVTEHIETENPRLKSVLETTKRK